MKKEQRRERKKERKNERKKERRKERKKEGKKENVNTFLCSGLKGVAIMNEGNYSTRTEKNG
jgi:hypothetical protein